MTLATYDAKFLPSPVFQNHSWMLSQIVTDKMKSTKFPKACKTAMTSFMISVFATERFSTLKTSKQILRREKTPLMHMKQIKYSWMSDTAYQKLFSSTIARITKMPRMPSQTT